MTDHAVEMVGLEFICPVCATVRKGYVPVDHNGEEYVVEVEKVRVTRLDCEVCGEERPHKPVAVMEAEAAR